jgi:hypothetical protein
MVEPTFFRFLEAALGALRVEAPRAYASLIAALAPTGLELRVDGNTRFFSVVNGVHRLTGTGCSAVSLATRRTVLVALLEARRTLVDAVVDDELELRGAPEHVIALDGALTAFFAGAVRSRSLPALLREYLSSPLKSSSVERAGSQPAATR